MEIAILAGLKKWKKGVKNGDFLPNVDNFFDSIFI
jgi:hypothetical protein